MSNEQIAHDLAVAKLYGSDLESKELIETYRTYYQEILSVLNSEPKQPSKPKTAQFIPSPV